MSEQKKGKRGPKILFSERVQMAFIMEKSTRDEFLVLCKENKISAAKVIRNFINETLKKGVIKK